MDSVKLSIKLGSLEVTYEGHQSFVEIGLLDIIERLAALEIPDVVAPTALTWAGGPAPVGVSQPFSAQVGSDSQSRLSTTDFAVKMAVKSGSDLAMAAAAYLHHTKGMEDFRRSDLLAAMRSAKPFYKASYGSNLSKSLEMLTKTGRLQNPRADTFALPYPEIAATKIFL